jgi:glycosyltransferase involved in cell wall biosynthesis
VKVVFLQRIFAHYQWGLVQELAEHGEHEYSFIGDTRDPCGSGIEVIPEKRLEQVAFTAGRTWQIGKRVAFQPVAVRVAAGGHYDVLILEGSMGLATTWAAIKAAHGRGKRVLLYTHGWTRQSERGWIGGARTRFLRSADGLLLYGARAKAIGRARGVPEERMHVVFNSLDHRTMTACRRRIGDAVLNEFRSVAFGSAELPIVAYVGRVRKEKQLGIVVRALARLKTRNVRAGFLVVGGGSAAAELQEMCESMGIPGCFTGPIGDEEKLSVMLSASRVAVAPAAAGLMVVHAMSYGTPVLTHCDFDHQVPEAEAVVPGVTGELFSPGDEAGLCDKLSLFLGPDDARARYAESCMEMVDRYYNPAFMRGVFDRAVSGLPAQDNWIWPALGWQGAKRG